MFRPCGIEHQENAYVVIGFCEQSKRSKGFHSNKNSGLINSKQCKYTLLHLVHLSCMHYMVAHENLALIQMQMV